MAGQRLAGRKAIAVVAAIIAIGALLWLLFVNKRPVAPAPAPTAAATPAPAPAATNAPPDQLAAAVQAAFPDGAAGTDDEGQRFTFGNHRLVIAPFGPVLVSEGKAVDGAHVATGRLDVAYLTPAAGGFTVAKRFPGAVRIGSFGEMGGWSVSDAFADRPVMDAEGSTTGQGYTCGYNVLTELTPAGPVEVARVQTTYDDSGAVGANARTLNGKIDDIERNRGFTVRYTGTDSFAERWRRQGGRYVPLAPTKVPGC